MAQMLKTVRDMGRAAKVLEPSHKPKVHMSDIVQVAASGSNMALDSDEQQVSTLGSGEVVAEEGEKAETAEEATASQALIDEAQRKKTAGIWWYMRHPWARLATACFIFVLDFIYYAEDPIVHTHLTTELPVGGNAATMMVSQWPSTAGLCFLKVAWGWSCVLSGCVVGRQLIHGKLLSMCNMFEDSNGSWTVMGLTAVVCLWLGSYVYNAMVGDDEPQVTSDLHLQGYHFGLIAQMCTWIGDLWTLIMVLDSMLQDTQKYPEWLAGGPKEFWGRWRITGCWLIAVVPTMICYTMLILEEEDDTNAWDDISPGMTDIGRCTIVGFIMLFDLSILIQDWEFPTFDSDIGADILIPGFNVTDVDFTFCNWLHETRCCTWCMFNCVDKSFFHVQVSGKWIAYGPLLCILCLDLNCARNQVTYEPVNFGQYVDPSNYEIWSIVDSSTLATNFDGLIVLNSTAISWDARKGNSDASYAAGLSDIHLSAQFTDASYAFKFGVLAIGLLAIPGTIALAISKNETQVLRKARWKKAGRGMAALKSASMMSLQGMTAKVAPADETNPVNDEGALMKFGTDAMYYCGRDLGTTQIPGSDGHCGPNNGPQCASCRRYEEGGEGVAEMEPARPATKLSAKNSTLSSSEDTEPPIVVKHLASWNSPTNHHQSPRASDNADQNDEADPSSQIGSEADQPSQSDSSCERLELPN